MLPYAEESLPFGDDLLVFKVKGRIFAILPLDEDEPRVSLKCDPDRCEELRAHYDAVIPGYHLNKRHWNSVYLERDLPADQILHLIRHSYDLVVAKAPQGRAPRTTRPSTHLQINNHSPHGHLTPRIH